MNQESDDTPGLRENRSAGRPEYVWDYVLTEAHFLASFRGELRLGRLDQAWADVRLLEYPPYEEIRELIGFTLLVRKWPEWRERVRSRQRREAVDFLVDWLPENHPQLLGP